MANRTRPLPPDWDERRAAAIARDGGLCTETTCPDLAVDVDHTIPRSLGGSDDLDNLKSKCKSHHGKKTARERRGDVFVFLDGVES